MGAVSYARMKSWLDEELEEIRRDGLFKEEKLLNGPQGPQVDTGEGEVINFCSNNYLGLADHPEIAKAVEDGMRTHGFGIASTRFICGTQDIHKTLERRLSEFLGTEGTILYTSCYDANLGLFQTLLGPEDATISDALNHASIIDGLRLCRAQRLVYRHSDMQDLEEKLKEAESARFRLIGTDGVFSMEGDTARLAEICDLANRYDALVMVDDSHATGLVGATGRGTPEELGMSERIDVITSTMSKALGGGSGGFTSGRREIIDYLRQRSRNYIFSNAMAPPVVMGSLKALDLVQEGGDFRSTLWENTRYFRARIEDLGFQIVAGNHPIVPLMLGDELKTAEMARLVNERGIFVVGFSFPVVPRGEARIRVQISAGHTREQLDRALSVFEEVGKQVGAI